MTIVNGHRFNPPPGWPVPADWAPHEGWTPDPSWPPAPENWTFWIPAATPSIEPETATPADNNEIERLRTRVAELEQALAQATTAETSVFDDEAMLQEVGIYRYHHPLENAAQFKERLSSLQDEIKQAIKDGDAVLASDMFTFNNSLARGRKMTGDLSKLMLRAYNSDVDSAVRALRAGNVEAAKKRVNRTVDAVAKLGSMMEMRINPDYHELRLREIELTADFAIKKQEEKEAEREERARLREEKRVEQELAAKRAELDKERTHILNALQALREAGDHAGVAELEAKLADVDGAIEDNDYRAANVRAGYVYVISNKGTFGTGVIKIGMTRRLEPMDRVRELGDASVPFPFDVHALFFADDAVTLEGELHQHFADRRLNHVNLRREYFFATPSEVRDVLAAKVGNLLEFTEKPDAEQYNQSKKQWPETARNG